MSHGWMRSLCAAALLCAALLGAAPVRAAAPPLGQVLAQARAQHRALVVEFGTGWCEACKSLDEDVLALPRVRRALAGVIFVRYDAEQGEGVAAARALKVIGYPTILALAGDGAEIDRIVGVPETADFVRWLQRLGQRRPAAVIRPVSASWLR